jgi:hypothetical protein
VGYHRCVPIMYYYILYTHYHLMMIVILT